MGPGKLRTFLLHHLPISSRGLLMVAMMRFSGRQIMVKQKSLTSHLLSSMSTSHGEAQMILWFFQKFQVVENQGDRELYTYTILKMFYSFNSEISSRRLCTSHYKQIYHFPSVLLMAHLCDFLNER